MPDVPGHQVVRARCLWAFQEDVICGILCGLDPPRRFHHECPAFNQIKQLPPARFRNS